ncbi:MAG: HNH endonuclease family protein [Gordonia sp. (in: high G+C Gram-positive bacteria)]|uniref:HNH endonuclease family protein n=1 Tax=Gordonia sp. (in: high G+C Gram-positive bacteria) TaxID=84139 RepID=UPI0039E2612F
MSPYDNRGGYRRRGSSSYSSGYSHSGYSSGYHHRYSRHWSFLRRHGLVATILLVVALMGVGLILWAVLGDDDGAGGTPAATTPSAAPSTTNRAQALAQLAALPVRNQDPWETYDRTQFGDPWSDDVDVQYGHNGCNTRDDILHRDLVNVVMRSGGCFVSSGILHDQYTGNTMNFVRGPNTSDEVEIDHIVPLGDAWRKGAQELTPQERLNFANDPRNLQAVAQSVNQDKQSMDASEWLPPNQAYHCTYVERQIEVKTAYRLWLTQSEKDAMGRILATC